MTEFTAAQKFETTAELYFAGVKIMRQNLKRQHPDWTDAQLDEGLLAWMCAPESHPAPSSDSSK